MKEVRPDCRYFSGQTPCAPNKEYGVECRCRFFSPWKERILVVKLDALGDVLRSTCILTGLKQQYPESYIAWVTRGESVPIFANNELVDEVIAFDESVTLRLMTETFDLLFALDNNRPAAALASVARARQKYGFVLDENGRICALNPEATEWLTMAAFDSAKSFNRKSYQQIIHEICCLSWTGARPVLRLSSQEQAFAQDFAQRHGLSGTGPVIGLFTGVGRRWPSKSWPESGFATLLGLLKNVEGLSVLLLGGADERERNRRLLTIPATGAVDAGCENSLREFFALVNLCDLVVTADTLPLHIATALGKKVVALVGPTSAAEIELYQRGVLLQPEERCRCYYLTRCQQERSCMESLSAQRVFEAIRSLL